jgi:hypothetical protein
VSALVESVGRDYVSEERYLKHVGKRSGRAVVNTVSRITLVNYVSDINRAR